MACQIGRDALSRVVLDVVVVERVVLAVAAVRPEELGGNLGPVRRLEPKETKR